MSVFLKLCTQFWCGGSGSPPAGSTRDALRSAVSARPPRAQTQRRVLLRISTQTCKRDTGDITAITDSLETPFSSELHFILDAHSPGRGTRTAAPPPTRGLASDPHPQPCTRTPSSGTPPPASRWVSVWTFFNSCFLRSGLC